MSEVANIAGANIAGANIAGANIAGTEVAGALPEAPKDIDQLLQVIASHAGMTEHFLV